MGWLKTHPSKRGALERLSFEAEAVWHTVNLYCCAVGNDGRLSKHELHVAVSRKITALRAQRLAGELVSAGLWLEQGDSYELVDWLNDGARAIPLREASKAKDDGRLPMTDHNTRIFVVGETGAQARLVAEAMRRSRR